VPISGIREAVVVTTRKTKTGTETTVKIDHRIPESAAGRSARWRISTSPSHLPVGAFENAARVNTRSAEGRAITCIDVITNATVAAVAYHIDTARRPVLLQAAAVRSDPSMTDQSNGCVLILKSYLHEIARKLGRHGVVAHITSTRAEERNYIDRFGFRPAALPASWTRYGTIYLTQPPSD
jgi:L-amino acid N-acyltransferase YncA